MGCTLSGHSTWWQEGVAAGAWGSWSHCIWNMEAENRQEIGPGSDASMSTSMTYFSVRFQFFRFCHLPKHITCWGSSDQTHKLMANVSQSNHHSSLLLHVRTWQEVPCVSMRYLWDLMYLWDHLHDADGETLASADITSYYTGQRRWRIQRETLKSNSPLCWGEEKTQHQHAFKCPKSPSTDCIWRVRSSGESHNHKNMGADLNGSLMVRNLFRTMGCWWKVAWDWPDEIIHTQNQFKQEHGHFRA